MSRCIYGSNNGGNRTDRRKGEVRDRILDAAFELFLSQGIDATKIHAICERAAVANRTFFTHFATRQNMVHTLAEKRLLHLPEVLFNRTDSALPEPLARAFAAITA